MQAFHFRNSFSDKPLKTIMRVQAEQRTFANMKKVLMKEYELSTEDLRSQFFNVKIQEKETDS